MRDTVFGVPATLKPRFPLVYSPRPDGTLAALMQRVETLIYQAIVD
jgi:hypothetical protein